LRNAHRNELRDTSAPGVKTQNSIHQAAQTENLMQQICTGAKLQPAVPARALEIFQKNRAYYNKAHADGGIDKHLTHVEVACIFVAANEKGTPRTIWHLITNTSNAALLVERDVQNAIESLHIDQYKCIDLVALVDTVHHFNPELAGYAAAAQVILGRLRFNTKTPGQDKVALAFVYASAVKHDNIIQQSVVNTMHTFLSVPP